MIYKLSVIGSGIMGSGIAQVASTAGFEVSLHDANQKALAGALENIRQSLSRFVKKGKIDDKTRNNILSRITAKDDLLSSVKDADYIIEAVSEDLDLKLSVFEQIDRMAPEGAILATNTSQYSITQISAATNRPSLVIGTHFFNPPVIMRLIEVVSGLDTSDDTLQTTLDVAKQMGKEVVLCKDSQGFITSRLINFWLNEAERIFEEGLATKEDIDKACRLAFNHPMGPFELDDFSGLDTRLNICFALENALGPRFKPTRTLRNLVYAKRLGRKSGEGFFKYSKE